MLYASTKVSYITLWKKNSNKKGTTNFKSWRDLRSEEHKQVPRNYDLTLRLLSFTELQILNLKVNVCCTFLSDEGGTRTLNLQLHATLCYHSQTNNSTYDSTLIVLYPHQLFTLMKQFHLYEYRLGGHLSMTLPMCLYYVCCSLEYIFTILKFLQVINNRQSIGSFMLGITR